MARQSLIFFLLISYLSCSIHYDKQNDCNYKVKKVLKDVSKYITMNKETKVYTLFFSELPDFDRAMHQKRIDSLEKLMFIPPHDSIVKHAIYSQQLRNLAHLDCNITIEDIRKYFGRESTIGSINTKILWLDYVFNNISYPDCFDRYAKSGAYSKCGTLRLLVDEKGRLTEVLTGYFL